MIERIPNYYPQFTCLAGTCPDSCCQEWEVDIDPKTAKLYRDLPGKLGDALREKMRMEDGTVYLTISDRRCPMWRQDGLCEIQCQLGHDALSQTCQAFPRLTHDYGDFVERGLELSCPAAAKLILSGENQEISAYKLPGEGSGDYDREVMDILLQSREVLLSFWEEMPYPLPKMLAITLLYAHEVQAELDGGKTAVLSAEDALADALSYAQGGDLDALRTFFLGLEILTPAWESRLGSPAPALQWENCNRALVRYFICRYWLQAVSDYDVLCRAKFAVVACLLIASLGGEMVETAQLFSKEIENDADNVEAILDGAYTCPAMTDVALLGLLLKGV